VIARSSVAKPVDVACTCFGCSRILDCSQNDGDHGTKKNNCTCATHVHIMYSHAYSRTLDEQVDVGQLSDRSSLTKQF
jgi:hypothetical protein